MIQRGFNKMDWVREKKEYILKPDEEEVLKLIKKRRLNKK